MYDYYISLKEYKPNVLFNCENWKFVYWCFSLTYLDFVFVHSSIQVAAVMPSWHCLSLSWPRSCSKAHWTLRMCYMLTWKRFILCWIAFLLHLADIISVLHVFYCGIVPVRFHVFFNSLFCLFLLNQINTSHDSLSTFSNKS